MLGTNLFGVSSSLPTLAAIKHRRREISFQCFWTGSPGSPKRTWADKVLFQCFHSTCKGSYFGQQCLPQNPAGRGQPSPAALTRMALVPVQCRASVSLITKPRTAENAPQPRG